MTEHYDGPFSRLRVKVDTELFAPHHHTVEMRGADGTTGDDPNTNGVVAHLKEHGHQDAENAAALWQDLTQADDQMMEWIQADAANSTLFFKDPIAAVRVALPHIKNELLATTRPK